MENNEMAMMLIASIALITSAVAILITLTTIEEVKKQIRRVNMVKLKIDTLKNEVRSLKNQINDGFQTCGGLYVDGTDQIDKVSARVDRLNYKIKDLFWIIEALEIRPRRKNHVFRNSRSIEK